MSEQKKLKFILSGGGTGGHLFPAIAIANQLKTRYPDAEFLFVGAKGKMEMEKVPQAGYAIKGLWIGGFQRSNLIKNINLPFKIISSLRNSAKILKDFKPDVVIGTGGYASFPLIYKASKQNIPSLIQEQNFFPGITNKYLGKYVNKICTVYKGMEKYFPAEKIVITGNPVRENIKIDPKEKARALKEFGLSEAKKTVLIIGGSLGARTINQAIEKGVRQLLESGIQVIWQTGKFYYDDIKARANEWSGEHLWLGAFINNMGLAYLAADIVVSRAGAISLSELALLGKTSILVPSPNVAEDHQTKNAMSLVEAQAATLIKDAQAQDLLVDEILNTINNPDLRERLSNNILAFAKPNATSDIVNEIEKLIIKR